MNSDTLKGMLWGAAVGDALGTPHEFRTGVKLSEYTGLLEFAPISQSRWQGRRRGVVGQYSDDTEMTLALATSLATFETYVKEGAVLEYLKWANSGSPFMGRNTRALLKGVKTVRGYEARFEKTFGNTAQETWTQSNGCLMRCSPLAVLGEEAANAARVDCAITNPSPVCLDACEAYVCAIRDIGSGAAVEDVFETLVELGEDGVVREAIIDAIQSDDKRNVSDKQSKGWVVHALWCALRALRQIAEGESYEDIVDWVIRLGGDTDTNACIAGALLGSYVGYFAMSSEERTTANIKTIRESDTRLGDLARPHNYDPDRIDTVVAELKTFLV